MEFNSIDDYINYVRKETKKSFQVVADNIFQKWQDKVKAEMYSYQNKQYEKTWELFDSVKITPVMEQGDGFVVEIYVEDKLHGDTPQWTGTVSTYPKIYDMFANGFHNDQELNPSKEIQEEYILTKKWLDELKEDLRSKGLTVG